MSNGCSWTVLDGTRLRDIKSSIPEIHSAITGDQLLRLAESKASSALLGISLPAAIKSSALSRLHLDDDAAFLHTTLDPVQASSVLIQYLSAISDEINDDPIIVSVLDGSFLKILLEDEDEFAMLAENLFTELDEEDKGKIGKNEMENALVRMNVDMGVPPFSEFPLLHDIIKRHGEGGEGDLGQAQFAHVLQLILQDLSEALAMKNVFIIRNITIINGSKLKKLLGDENQLDLVMKSVWQQKAGGGEDGVLCTENLRDFLQENGVELGLPPPESDLYDVFFANTGGRIRDGKLGKGEFQVIVKEILQKFADELQRNPVLHDLDV